MTIHAKSTAMLTRFAHRLREPLSTPRLELEPMVSHHADAFFAPMQDESLYEWISMQRPSSLEWLRARWRNIEHWVAPDGQETRPVWAVRRKRDGAYLGSVDAEINHTLEAVNFGYYFFSEHWGQGYATEAATAATEHLMARGVHRLVATVTKGNAASARVLLKAGYQFTRILEGNDTIRGVVMDDEEYVKTAA